MTSEIKDLPGCAVIGAGGHAAVVVDAMIAQLRYKPIIIAECNDAPLIQAIGSAVIGLDCDLPGLVSTGQVAHFIIAFGALSSWSKRQEVFSRLSKLDGISPALVAHPSSTLSKFSKIANGCFVGANAIVNVGSEVGKNCVLNTSAIVEHHCVLGENVHVAPGAVLCGGVSIGANTFVGSNAVIREGIKIGEGCVIGAGSVVIRDIPSNTTVVGSSQIVARENKH